MYAAFISISLSLCFFWVWSFNGSSQESFLNQGRKPPHGVWVILISDGSYGPWWTMTHFYHVSCFSPSKPCKVCGSVWGSWGREFQPIAHDAFEMPSNAIGYHRFYTQEVSMWIELDRSAPHSSTLHHDSTIRYYTSSKEKTQRCLYTLCTSAWRACESLQLPLKSWILTSGTVLPRKPERNCNRMEPIGTQCLPAMTMNA